MNCRNSSTPDPRRTWAWLKSGLLGAALALFGTAPAQITAYNRTVLSAQTYTQIPGGTVINSNAQLTHPTLGATQDDGGVVVTLPFTFTYDGSSYTEVTFCTNGWIGMGQQVGVSASQGRAAGNLFSTTIPNNTIGAWFGDGNANWPTGSMVHGSTGTDEYAFEWRNASGSGFSVSATILINYMIKLYGPASASPGRIELLYGSTAGTISTSRSNGIENATGGANNFINALNGSFTLTTTNSAWPGNGNGYRFDPPVPCSTVTGGTAAATVTTGCATIATSTLSVTGSNTGETGLSYQWYSGPVGGPWTTALGTAATQVVTSVTSTTGYVRQITCANGGATALSSEVVLTVNPLPSVGASPANSDYCANTTPGAALSATGAVNYSWAPAAGLSATTGSSVEASPSSTTTYTVTGTDGEGCTATATATVTVIGAAPVIQSATADPSTTCFNGNSQLNVSGNIPGPANQRLFSATTGGLDPMTGATTVTTSTNDDGPSALQPIGFTFNFAGVANTQWSCTPDGFLRLGNTVATADFSNGINENTNMPKIMAYYDDLSTGTDGNIKSLVTGTAPNRILKVQWFVTIPRNTSGPANSTFQIWLYETTDAIEFHYGTMGAASMSASVGIAESTTNYQSVTISGPTASTVTVDNANAGQPADGTVYSFAHPVATDFLWTPSDFIAGQETLSNPLATGINVPSVTYTVTATNGLCSNQTTVLVSTSDPITNASITGALAYCVGGSTTLTAVPGDGGGPFTYLWSPGGETTESIEVSVAGLYSCQVTDNCGGSVNTGDVSVSENPLPTVEVDPASASSCDGASVALNASGADSYSWAPAGGLDATEGATVNAAPAGTTTYTVTGTDANGCENTATATVTVGAAPVITSTTATPETACPGTDVQLQVTTQSPSLSYCAAAATSTSFEKISGVQIADISYPNSGTAGYQDFTAITGNVTAGQNYTLQIDVSAAYANNDKVFLWVDANQDGTFANDPSELLWSDFVSTFCPACSGTAAVLTGSATIPASALNGSTRMRIRLEDLASTNTQAPCGNSTYGQVEDYTLSVTGGADLYTYSWDPAAGLSDATIANPVAQAVTEGATYTVTVSDAAGCSATGEASFSLLAAPPAPDVTPASATVCPGGNVQLSAVVNDGSGAVPYCNSNFTSVTYEFITNVTFQEINFSSGANLGGPVDYTSSVANVNAGSAYDLSVTMDPDANDYIYAWFDWNQNGLFTDPGEQITVVANSSAAGPHTISIPVPAIAYNGNTRMRVMVDWNNATPDPCRNATFGEAEDYTVNVSGGDEPPPPPVYTWSWSPADFLSDAGIADPMVDDITSTTTYTVTATNELGCASEGTEVTVTVDPLLTPPAPTAGADPGTVCPGSTTQLSAAVGSTPSYCNSAFTNVTYEHITNVTYAGINNTSGGNTGGPVDYTAQVANVAVGTPNDLSVTIQVDGNENISAWIDWNQNGVFTDLGESYTLATLASTAGPFTISITPPGGALNGNTRMRVQLSYFTAAAPCLSSTYGESEDYTVNVSGGSAPCTAGYTFSWSPATGLDDANTCNPVATVTEATTYTVTATNMNGCSNSSTVEVVVETEDGDADGTPDCADGCPTDPDKADPGQCGCFNPETDSDGDATADCVDGCPTDANKTEPGLCGCGVSDADSDSDGTVDCFDLCPNDPEKIVPGACGCGAPDTDEDEDDIADCIDSCLGVFGQVGSPCDDGNATSINDVLTESCECLGTPIVCEENGVLLDLSTDDNGSETSWDIVLQGTTDVACSGTGYLPNQTITLACCLTDGCYELRVFDSAGDGMANGTTGGYVLTTAEGDRIIDNGGDGIFASLSQVSGNLGFCLPLGTDKVIPAHCDKNDWTIVDIIQAQINPAVTAQYGVTNATSGYQFWFFNPDGGYNRRIAQTHAAPGTVTGVSANQRAAFLKLNAMVSYPLPAYTNLNVRVRTQVAGVFSEWGPACRFALNPPCATTQLTTLASPVVSCGATGLALTSRIYATAVPGANLYQFEFTKPGYLRRIAQTDRSTLLNFVTYPLTNNTCYNVRVRVSFDGGNTYCPFGAQCTITIGSAICGEAMPLAPDDAADFATEERLTIWPNPNDGSLVNLAFTGLTSDVSTVGVDVTDAFGRLVTTRTLPVQDGLIRTTMSFDETLAPGLYLVNLQAGDLRWTERLVIQ